MENKLSEFFTELTKFGLIIERFDEVMLNKINKEALTQLREMVTYEYFRRDEFLFFEEKVK
jgi:hypothetical protein